MEFEQRLSLIQFVSIMTANGPIGAARSNRSSEDSTCSDYGRESISCTNCSDEEICNTIMGEHGFEWARNRAILLGVNWNDIEVFSELFSVTERADVEGDF